MLPLSYLTITTIVTAWARTHRRFYGVCVSSESITKISVHCSLSTSNWASQLPVYRTTVALNSSILAMRALVTRSDISRPVDRKYFSTLYPRLSPDSHVFSQDKHLANLFLLPWEIQSWNILAACAVTSVNALLDHFLYTESLSLFLTTTSHYSG